MKDTHSAIVIGASAGALEALTKLLSALPAGYKLPIFTVVHLPAGRNSLLTQLLQSKCALSICEAEDKLPIKPATVYIAPPDYHLMIENREIIALSNEEEVLYSRPSIDVLFESAVDVYGEELIAVVLTGANHDGSRGARLIQEAGGTVLVQSPAEAYAKAMPEAALLSCKMTGGLPLAQIAQKLTEYV